MKDYNKETEKNDHKKKIIIIILIILLLLLLSSCCGMKYLGKIGDIFNNGSHTNIGDNTGDKEVIRNKNLRFDINKINMSLSDYAVKVSFTYEGINPKKFTCSTSDASKATCYVEDGYIVIIPKAPGDVTVILKTETNGKEYEATIDVTITEASKYIVLSSTKGSINLAKTNKKTVAYTLVGVKGNVIVNSSDESIAKATAKNGIINITAFKKGDVKITLTLIENGTKYTSTYTLNVINKSGEEKPNTDPVKPVDKEEDKNNYLSNLTSTNYPLNETFNKGKNDYTITVPYNENSISLNATKESANSTVEYKLNGKTVDNLNNLPLKEGDNKVEIIVTAANGDKNTYTVTIHKPVRTISFENDKTNYDIILNGYPYNIVYVIKEDGEEIDDYNVNDVKASLSNYNGSYKVNKGYIELNPNNLMAGKTSNLTVNYNGKNVGATLSFHMPEYYLYSYPRTYTIGLENGTGYKNLILNTNMFEEKIKVTEILNGIRLESSNGEIYINITSDSDIIKFLLEDTNPSNSLVVKALASKEGQTNIKISGYAYGKHINTIEMLLTATNKHLVVLDANGGFYDEFTTVYEFKVTDSDTINLGEYTPYKVDENGNCKYFEIASYNTKPDGSGETYQKDQILSNITNSIKLYAIYNSESSYKELQDTYKLYLTDVDLFHNDKYFQMYGEDKVIYPGAYGSYIMTFENQTASDITITGMTLEENTICLNGGCLNMGYIIKHAAPADPYTYYYGASNKYTVLNKDGQRDLINNYASKKIIFDEDKKITIKKGESAEISLLWQWVDEDDALDTLIGDSVVNNLNDKYELIVSLDFEKTNKFCSIE